MKTGRPPKSGDPGAQGEGVVNESQDSLSYSKTSRGHLTKTDKRERKIIGPTKTLRKVVPIKKMHL